MGNFVSAPIKKLLGQYTYNFSQEQLSLQILRGNFKIENLIINDQEINRILKEKGLPFKLKFGLLKKFEMKLSLIGTKIEKLDIEDLILIAGPERVEDAKVHGAEEDQMYNHVLKNLSKEAKKQRTMQTFNPVGLFKDLETEFANKRATKEPVENVQNGKKNGVDVMSIELIELLKHFLDVDIAIKNITFIYEDNLEFIYSKETLDTFITTINFKEFRFKSQDPIQQTDSQGIFKNFFNIKTFLEKSGTWGETKASCWNFTVADISTSFSVRNPLFVNNSSNNASLDSKNITMVLKRFYENLKADKLQNSFDLLTLKKITADVVMFYNDSSKIPVNAVFLLFDLSEVIFNAEINKLSTVFDVLAFFKNISTVKQIALVKPKFKILTPKTFNAACKRLKLNQEQTGLLSQFNKYVIREYIQESLHLIRYSAYISEGIDNDLARLLVIKSYCDQSRIYKLIFGDTYPEFINKEIELRQKSMNDIKADKELQTKADKINDANKKLESKERISDDPTALILKRIHIHMRIQFNAKLHILSENTLTPEHSMQINSVTLDVLNPAAHLRAKVHFTIASIIFNFSKEVYPIVKKSKMGIFASQKGNSRIELDNTSSNTLELKSLAISAEISVDQNKDGENVYFIYMNSQVGPIICNYMPNVFKNLSETLIQMNWAFSRNFKYKLAKEVDRNIQQLQHGQYYAQKQNVNLALKNAAFERKVSNLKKGSETYSKFSTKRFQHLYDSKKNISFKTVHHSVKKSNVVIDFAHTDKKKKEEMELLAKKYNGVKPTNGKVELESEEERKKKATELMFRNLTKLFTTLVLQINLRTKPLHLNVFDEDFNEALSVRYDEEEIKIDIDLAFKEITVVKALGLELQSKRSLIALRSLVERVMKNMEEIQNYQKLSL